MKKEVISLRSARAAGLVSVSARVFLGLAVEAPATYGGAWLCAMLGGLLAAPWIACLRYLRGRDGLFMKALNIALLALTAFDASTVLSALSRSAGYLALDRSPALALALPAALAALWCVWRGGDAIGFGAMLWARIACALLLVVALLQWRYLRPAWLRPLLGSGTQSIIVGGVRTAGWIVSASSVLAIAEDERESKPVRLWPMLAGALGLSAVLLALRQMMMPTPISDDSWLNRLDALLCNGRAPLYLQFPLISLWFAGLLHLLASDCFTASALLGRLFPVFGRRWRGVIAVGAVFVTAYAGLSEGLKNSVYNYSFAAIGTLTALALILGKAKGGNVPCAFDG